MDTQQVAFNSHEEAADAWLGGDSPWVRRIIGITPAPQVGSLYNEGIWDSNAAVWRGKDVVRTTESDHAQRTPFLLGTPRPQVVPWNQWWSLPGAVLSRAFCAVAWRWAACK